MEEFDAEMDELFKALMAAEQEERKARKEASRARDRSAAAKKQVDKLRAILEDKLKKEGLVEHIIAGRVSEYIINFGTPRKTVKVVDPDAVPDEFCKIERKPKKKEIGEYLKEHKVNWAALEEGKPYLQWRMRKKG